jgi:competence protein ComFB
VELLQNGKLVEMKDNNWQNPYNLIPNTGGTFTFWPKPVTAEKTDINKVFEFTIKIASADFAELNHVLSIPVISEMAAPSISLSRTHKLPDLYLFPPGEEKDQLVLSI